MNIEEYLREEANYLAREIACNSRIKKFVKNSDVIGAYAEATVRRLVSEVVSPLRVSTGAVIGAKLCKDPTNIPQLDTIIWSPCPAPPIFHIGEFGLVPRSSCFGVMEIKRSAYDGCADRMPKLFDREDELVADVVRERRDKHANDARYKPQPALGVICLKENGQSTSKLQPLIDTGRVLVLLEETGNGDYKPWPEAFYRLLNFLTQVRASAKAVEGRNFVNLDALKSLSRADGSA